MKGEGAGVAEAIASQFDMGFLGNRAMALVQASGLIGERAKGKTVLQTAAGLLIDTLGEMSSTMTGASEVSQMPLLMQKQFEGRPLTEIMQGATQDTSTPAASRLGMGFARAFGPVALGRPMEQQQLADSALGQAAQVVGGAFEAPSPTPPTARDYESQWANMESGIQRGMYEVMEDAYIRAFTSVREAGGVNRWLAAQGKDGGASFNAHLTAHLWIGQDVHKGLLVDEPKSMVGKYIKRVARDADHEQRLIEAYRSRYHTIDPDVEKSLEILVANSDALSMSPEVLQKAVRGMLRSTSTSDQTLQAMYKSLVEEKRVEEIDVWHQVYVWGKFGDKDSREAAKLKELFEKAGYGEYAPDIVSYERLTDVLGPDPYATSPMLATQAYAQMLGGS